MWIRKSGNGTGEDLMRVLFLRFKKKKYFMLFLRIVSPHAVCAQKTHFKVVLEVTVFLWLFLWIWQSINHFVIPETSETLGSDFWTVKCCVLNFPNNVLRWVSFSLVGECIPFSGSDHQQLLLNTQDACSWGQSHRVYLVCSHPPRFRQSFLKNWQLTGKQAVQSSCPTVSVPLPSPPCASAAAPCGWQCGLAWSRAPSAPSG